MSPSNALVQGNFSKYSDAKIVRFPYQTILQFPVDTKWVFYNYFNSDTNYLLS